MGGDFFGCVGVASALLMALAASIVHQAS